VSPVPAVPLCTAAPPPGVVAWQSAGPSVPSEGVITEFRTANAGAAGTQFAFRVIRGGKSIATVPATLDSAGAATADARVPVQGGDQLGVNTVSGTLGCIFPGVAGEAVQGAANVADGVSLVPLGTIPGARVNALGVLEPDADRDGYGDETQDQCGSDAATQGPCDTDLALTASLVERTVTVGGLQVVTLRAAVPAAAGTARGARIALGVPAGTELVAASGPGSCSGASCELGDVGPGESGVMVAVLRATSAGAKALSASATTSTADTNAANNSANLAFEVAAPAVQAVAQNVAPPAPRCKVVKLADLSQDAARKALVAGNCRLGKVTKPRRIRKGARLRVSRQSIPQGLEGPVGTKVDLVMKQVGGKKAARKNRRS
jgi:hypothetical protein